MSDTNPSQSLRAPAVVLLVGLAGAAAALAGGYWDDAWHTDRGRDTFFIAPHLAIYLGVGVAGAALSAWGLLAVRRLGMARAVGHPPLALGLLSVAATLASGPVDDAWHLAFGRDAVIWSPPHLLGIVGTLGIAVAFLSELAGSRERAGRAAAIAAGGLVLAAASFVTVEYDTDVPQFHERWYLPVLALAAATAMLLVRRTLGGRWGATMATAAYTAMVAAVGVFLQAAGFDAPQLPLLVPAAVVLDVSARRRASPPLAAAAFVTTLFATYVAVRNLFGDGVRFDAGDILVGLPLGWAAVAVVLTLAGRRWTGHDRAAGAVAAAALAVLLLPATASAHDPGQGGDAGAVDFGVAVSAGIASVRVELPRRVCEGTRSVALVARRAGRSLRAPLRKEGCILAGRIALAQTGRWFVYAEMRRGARRVESWLPVVVGDRPARVRDEARYAYFPQDPASGAVKIGAGVVLYGGVLALLVAMFRLTARPPGGGCSVLRRGGP